MEGPLALHPAGGHGEGDTEVRQGRGVRCVPGEGETPGGGGTQGLAPGDRLDIGDTIQDVVVVPGDAGGETAGNRISHSYSSSGQEEEGQ